MVESPGRVRRLTAAIVVNDRLAQPAVKGKAAAWQPRSADELRNLTALAQAAVGFDAARGDMLTVEDLAFDENRAQPPVSPLGSAWEMAERSPVLVKYAPCWRDFWWCWPSACVPRCATPQPQPGRAGAHKAPEQGSWQVQPTRRFSPPEPPELDPERIRAQEIFDQVTDHLKREPAQSSRLLQSWIHSE